MMPNIQFSDGVEAAMDMGQVAKKSRGRPKKMKITINQTRGGRRSLFVPQVQARGG
jgi:hypothetical protein